LIKNAARIFSSEKKGREGKRRRPQKKEGRENDQRGPLEEERQYVQFTGRVFGRGRKASGKESKGRGKIHERDSLWCILEVTRSRAVRKGKEVRN